MINWSVISVYVRYCAIGSNLKEDDYHFLGSRRLNQGQHSIAILTKKNKQKNKTKQNKAKQKPMFSLSSSSDFQLLHFEMLITG